MAQSKQDELYKALQQKGYPDSLCREIAYKQMNTDYTATRMLGYLYRISDPRPEDVVDEMLAILSDRNAIIQKKELEHAQATINKVYREDENRGKEMLNVIEIKDFNAPELDIYARCTEARLLNKDHPEEGMFIAESPKVIGRALDAGYEPLSVLVEKKQMEENEETSQIMNRFDDTKVSIFTADFEVLTKLTGFKLTRGMLCAMRRKPLRKFQDLCDGINRIAILENVQNPTNVGAIFRSAAALNMEAVLLSPGCSDPLYRRASRVSMGTVFQIPWTFIRDSNEMRCKREVIWPKQAIAELKKLGYKTAALALTDDSVSIDDSELMKEEKLAVILGNEGEGLENETIALCDYTVKIPMTHGVDSLNVAAASAVAFWQLGKIIL